MPTQIPKQQAGYLPTVPRKLWPAPGKGIRCGTCHYFGKIREDGPGTCRIVAGGVHSQACCNLWSLDGPLTLDYACGKDLKDIEDLAREEGTAAAAPSVCVLQ